MVEKADACQIRVSVKLAIYGIKCINNNFDIILLHLFESLEKIKMMSIQ